MKKYKISFAIVFTVIFFITSSFYRGQDLKLTQKATQDTSGNYPDGKYEGQSRYNYTDEPYWGSVHITIKKGLFTRINFMIRDSSLQEIFNKNYKKHFKGNPEYIQQCRNDWKGVKTYPKKLIKTQDIDKIDAMSGATWSYNIFKASVTEALKNAKKRTE